jgi:hypothetical protein
MRLIAIDFLLAFGLIWGSAFTVEFARLRAHAEGLLPRAAARAAADLANPGAHSESVDALPATGPNRLASYLLLSVAAAGLAALDLAFWRHLRRAYASPRRGRRRG